MKYHSLKMEEINRIIDELWKATYRGTDVDTVMIRSEGDDTKGNRSYNYRVRPHYHHNSLFVWQLVHMLIFRKGLHGQARRRIGHERPLQCRAEGARMYHN